MNKNSWAAHLLSTLMFLIGLPVFTYVLPGFQADSFFAAVCTGAVLAVMYLIARPILRLITKPLGCLTLGLIGLVIDLGLMYAADYLISGFHILGIEAPVIASVVFNVLHLIIRKIKKDDND